MTPPTFSLSKKDKPQTAETLRHLIRIDINDDDKSSLRRAALFYAFNRDGPRALNTLHAPMGNQLLNARLASSTIHWEGQWEFGTPEGQLNYPVRVVTVAEFKQVKLLYELGLQRVPPLATMINLASGTDRSVSRAALVFITEHFYHYQGERLDPFLTRRFIPAYDSSGAEVQASPMEV